MSIRRLSLEKYLYFSLNSKTFEIQLYFLENNYLFTCWESWHGLVLCENFSVMELVDAAIPPQHLEPYKQTILGVEGVKVGRFQVSGLTTSFFWFFFFFGPFLFIVSFNDIFVAKYRVIITSEEDELDQICTSMWMLRSVGSHLFS